MLAHTCALLRTAWVPSERCPSSVSEVKMWNRLLRRVSPRRSHPVNDACLCRASGVEGRSSHVSDCRPRKRCHSGLSHPRRPQPSPPVAAGRTCSAALSSNTSSSQRFFAHLQHQCKYAFLHCCCHYILNILEFCLSKNNSFNEHLWSYIEFPEDLLHSC